MSELKLHLERVKSHWKHAFFLAGLAAGLALVTSCGSSSSSTTPPSITASCTPTDVTVLNTAQCTATVLNLSSTLVNWSVAVTNGGTGSAGTITSGGLYTAPATVPSNSVTITATSQIQSTLTATQPVTIEPATQIHAVTCVDDTNATPSPLVVASNSQLACTATDPNGATVAVNWTVANATTGLAGNVGSVASNGIYTAPLVPPPGQNVKIIATSQSVSTITGSATATVVFGNSVLSGNYVFSTSGTLPTGAFWARTGSFSAGGGFINGGLEDTNQGGSPNTVTLRRFTGSYAVGADGRGTVQFCESAGANSQPPASCPFESGAATSFFRIAVVSPSQVQMIEFSSPTTSAATATAGGEMISQDPSVFQSGNQILDGVYSFGFSGVSNGSSGAAEETVAGEFAADGFQHIGQGSASAPGEMDIDSGGSAFLTSAAYSISTNGRGLVTLNGLSFSFYPVSASRAKFIEIDSGTTTPILAGDAYQQQTISTCGWTVNVALADTTVFETSGTVSTGPATTVPIADVGAFTPNNGAVTLISMDQNSGGTFSQPPGTGSDNYTMDKCGRGTLSVAGHSYVFYIISPSNAVLQETTVGTIAHGLLSISQSGSFADGSYAFRMEGIDAAGSSGQAEDFLGQFTSVTTTAPVTTTLNGTLDLNDFGATQTALPIASGTYTAPTTGPRSTATFPIGNPVTTRSLVLYMVSPTLYYVLDGVATAGPAIGVINNQF